MANAGQYRAVLDDLLKQQIGLQSRLTEIGSAIVALRTLMPDVEPASSAGRMPSAVGDGGKYAGMSVRWGVLALLTDDAKERMTTGAIALALQAGGVQTKGKSFAANVSAVLSNMNRSNQEVEATGEGWAITDKGREVWSHIKASRERHASNQGSQQSLEVQPLPVEEA